MKNGRTVAAAVAVGYLLGRSKKMKLALMVGAAAAGALMDKTALLSKGGDLLKSAPVKSSGVV